MKKDKKQPWFESVLAFFYPTSDDWYPNYPRDCVRVSLSVSHNPDHCGSIQHGVVRIIVYGPNDTALERVCIIENEQERLAKIVELKVWLENKLPNPLTKAWLMSQGFSHS